MDPLNLEIMDVDEFIKKNLVREVTSSFIKEPSTGNFDDNGLFSESIFGEIASTHRLVNHGYISLNSKIMHPKMFDIIGDFKSVYISILEGKQYAIFDDKEGDFVLANEDDKDAKTGYIFFINNVTKLKPKKNGAIRRDTKVDIFEKYRDKLFIHRIIVLPAGLRDYYDNGGRGEYDDINKLYMSLINLARVVSEKDSDNIIFNPILYSIQKKVNEIYEYILNILDGKAGYLQNRYGARAIALGTRNVISATDTSSLSTDDKSLLKSDEVLIPLFQVLNMYRPMIIYNLKNIFFNHIFNRDTVQASLIDTKTFALNYHTISLQEKSKFLTSDKIVDLIDIFRDDTVKHLPVIVRDDTGKELYMYITYRSGNNVYMARSLSDLNRLIETGEIDQVIMENVKPLTYFEMFYIAAFTLSNKYTTITRYPVTDAGSIFPARVHIATTVKYDTVNFISIANRELSITFDRYPIIGSSIVGSVSTHPCQLAPLGADHDGDTVSCLGIMSEEAIKECKEYLDSPVSIVNPNGKMLLGLTTGLSKVALYNFTREL